MKVRPGLSGLTAVAAAALSLASMAQEPEPTYSETMSIVRYVVDVRVHDASGRAVKGLASDDFEVTVGGQPAAVESASWTGRGAGVEPVAGESGPGAPPPGRLVVFFVHTDFGRAGQRVQGQMRFNETFLDPIFEMLGESDLVAVASFDSKMKLRCEFTLDRAAARAAIVDSIEIGDVPFPKAPESGPSLARFLDPEEMKRASRGENALVLLARAIRENDGEKLLVMPSWGMGERSALGGVSLRAEWDEAIGILRRDHVPVVSILTGLGGQLTVGVAQTARATGGMFASAISSFPEQSIGRVAGFVEGFYELTLRLERPLGVGEHEIKVRTKDRALTSRAAPMVVVEESDELWREAVRLFNADETQTALVLLRDSIAAEQVPDYVLEDRLRALVDAAQWEGALVVADALEGMGAADAEVVAMQEEARAGMAAMRRAGARDLLRDARQLLLDGSTDRVRKLLDDAIELEPHLADAWYERGMLRLSEGDAEGATGDLRRYLELAPGGEHSGDVRTTLDVIRR